VFGDVTVNHPSARIRPIEQYIHRFARTERVALREGARLVRTGHRRHARYQLPIPLRPTPRVAITESGEVIAE
jgi:hypothetical protein